MEDRWITSSLVFHFLDFLDADYIVDGLAAVTCSSTSCMDHHGWALEAPLRDRLRSLDLCWYLDGQRTAAGIPSIWT